MIILGRRDKKELSLVDKCIRSFFESTRNKHLTAKDLSELYRFSLCTALDLDTVSNCIDFDAVQPLVDIFKEYDVLDKSEEYRQGVLEACVHSYEMSRKYAGL